MTNDRADLAPSRPPIEEWPDRVRARLQARPRRYRFPAPRFRLSFRAARRTGSSRRTPPVWRCYDSPGMSMGDTLRSILTRLVAYVAVVIAAGPVAAWAQQQMPVIGWLSGVSSAAGQPILAAFSKALGDAGYVEGRNVQIEYRW